MYMFLTEYRNGSSPAVGVMSFAIQSSMTNGLLTLPGLVRIRASLRIARISSKKVSTALRRSVTITISTLRRT